MLNTFSKKLSYCCPSELETLMELPSVKIVRANYYFSYFVLYFCFKLYLKIKLNVYILIHIFYHRVEHVNYTRLAIKIYNL